MKSMRHVLLLLAAALACCASSSVSAAPVGLKDCKNVNWYNYGLRDGSMSGISSLEEYTKYCAEFGVKPDAAQYAKGLEEGRLQKRYRSHF